MERLQGKGGGRWEEGGRRKVGDEGLLEPVALKRLNTDNPINRFTDQSGDLTGDLSAPHNNWLLARPRSAFGARRRRGGAPEASEAMTALAWRVGGASRCQSRNPATGWVVTIGTLSTSTRYHGSTPAATDLLRATVPFSHDLLASLWDLAERSKQSTKTEPTWAASYRV